MIDDTNSDYCMESDTCVITECEEDTADSSLICPKHIFQHEKNVGAFSDDHDSIVDGRERNPCPNCGYCPNCGRGGGLPQPRVYW